MTNQILAKLAFAIAIFGAALTFVIGVALTLYGSGIPNFLKIVYDLIIFSCVAFYVRNIFMPIFPISLMEKKPKLRNSVALSLCYIITFQASVLYGFICVMNYVKIYVSYMIILQIVNLLMLWVIICASFGQNSFHPFFVKFMTNPAGALGYALGFSFVRNKKVPVANDRSRKS
jgi:hypothetical protein